MIRTKTYANFWAIQNETREAKKRARIRKKSSFNVIASFFISSRLLSAQISLHTPKGINLRKTDRRTCVKASHGALLLSRSPRRNNNKPPRIHFRVMNLIKLELEWKRGPKSAKFKSNEMCCFVFICARGGFRHTWDAKAFLNCVWCLLLGRIGIFSSLTRQSWSRSRWKQQNCRRYSIKAAARWWDDDFCAM